MATTRKYIYDVSTKGTQKATQSVNKLTGNFNKLAKQVGTAALAYFGARGLLNGFKQAIALAGEQEQAEKQLATALGHTSQALLRQASALQQVSVFGDETIIRGQALLAAFTDNEEQIKLLTIAALDLAAGKGMDLISTFDLISKSAFSSTNALSRYAITVEGAAGSTARLNQLAGEVSTKFGGQAAAAADTMTGAIQQADNAMGDAAETMGESFAPAVIFWSKIVKEAAEAYGNLFEAPVLGQMSELEESLVAQQKVFDNLLIRYNESTDFWERQTLLDALTKVKNVMIELKFPTVPPAPDFAEWIEYTTELEKVKDISASIEAQEKQSIETNKKLNLEKLKNTAIQAQTAKSGAIGVIKAETAEAVAGYIASILKSVPFPLNLILAATAGGAVNELMDSVIPAFATGGDFVTNGPQLALLGDNPGGRERVQVTPLSSPNVNGPQGGMVNNFYGPVTNEAYVRDELIPQIQKGLALA